MHAELTIKLLIMLPYKGMYAAWCWNEEQMKNVFDQSIISPPYAWIVAFYLRPGSSPRQATALAMYV
jgi:hypothetical protein